MYWLSILTRVGSWLPLQDALESKSTGQVQKEAEDTLVSFISGPSQNRFLAELAWTPRPLSSMSRRQASRHGSNQSAPAQRIDFLQLVHELVS